MSATVLLLKVSRAMCCERTRAQAHTRTSAQAHKRTSAQAHKRTSICKKHSPFGSPLLPLLVIYIYTAVLLQGPWTPYASISDRLFTSSSGASAWSTMGNCKKRKKNLLQSACFWTGLRLLQSVTCPFRSHVVWTFLSS